ncbi:diaminopimelate epimerase [Luteimonas dalianensis]|uniref:diaminopimelate epimerase n=1 Tax=Luteimonas dalianensis TaxID=1148196 RepID=UPI003BF23334
MNAAAPRPGASTFRFTKMHGAGNDFVMLDLRDGSPPPSPQLCRALADRHTGVGCDQIITIEPPRSPGAVAAYGIWNSDGSSGRQCGNGARCVAAWLQRAGAAPASFILDSPAGSHEVELLGEGRVRVVMGEPDFAAGAIPLAGFGAGDDPCVLDLGGMPVEFGAVSLGNPHAVIEVDDVDTAPVAAVGRALQDSPAFPDSVNVGFVQVLDRERVRLRVFERGVGETLACGSGACAAAAVLMRRRRVARAIDVALPGGTLRIEWPGEGQPVIMAGSAAFVFEGEWIHE